MHQHLVHYLGSQRTTFSVPSKTAELNHKDLNYILAVLVKNFLGFVVSFFAEADNRIESHNDATCSN